MLNTTTSEEISLIESAGCNFGPMALQDSTESFCRPKAAVKVQFGELTVIARFSATQRTTTGD
jgi:hypothetical protein